MHKHTHRNPQYSEVYIVMGKENSKQVMYHILDINTN